MSLEKKLNDAIKVVVDEIKNNQNFAYRLSVALDIKLDKNVHVKSISKKNEKPKRGHRRSPPLVDPIALARENEEILRSCLDDLTVDQLKDVIAEYGMDPGKLAMKWKKKERIIDRIVEYSFNRLKKGDSFLL